MPGDTTRYCCCCCCIATRPYIAAKRLCRNIADTLLPVHRTFISVQKAARAFTRVTENSATNWWSSTRSKEEDFANEFILEQVVMWWIKRALTRTPLLRFLFLRYMRIFSRSFYSVSGILVYTAQNRETKKRAKCVCCAYHTRGGTQHSPLYIMSRRPRKLTLCIYLSSLPAACFPASRSIHPSTAEASAATAAAAAAAAAFIVSGLTGEVSTLEVLPVSISSKASSSPGLTFADASLHPANNDEFLCLAQSKRHGGHVEGPGQVTVPHSGVPAVGAGVVVVVVMVVVVSSTSPELGATWRAGTWTLAAVFSGTAEVEGSGDAAAPMSDCSPRSRHDLNRWLQLVGHKRLGVGQLVFSTVLLQKSILLLRNAEI